MKTISIIFILLLMTCQSLASSYEEDLLHKAEQGELTAQLELAGRYQERRNYAEAMKWFRIAAKNGSELAAHRMGVFYRDGMGVKKDKTEAARWFFMALERGKPYSSSSDLDKLPEAVAQIIAEYRKAAEQGDATIQIKLGRIYVKGWGVSKNYPEAIAWYRKAAEQGDAEGQFILGKTYVENEIVARDYGEAMKWFYRAAAQGHSQAQGRIGLMYYLGAHVIRDEVEAAAWYYLSLGNGGNGLPSELEGRLGLDGRQQAQKRAKEIGSGQAAFQVGLMYRDGKGVEKDKTEAARWFLKAVETGDRFVLAAGYLEDTGAMPQLIAEYRKEAEQGDVTASIKLGCIYAKGWGVSKNYPEAIDWYRKAAEQGSAEGQYILGSTYAENEIVAPNYGEAMKWFYKAAAQGHAGAQGKIGLMYYLGTYMIRDEVEAAAWYYLSLSNGGDEPPSDLEKRLGLDGRQQAQKRAKELAAKIAAKEPLK